LDGAPLRELVDGLSPRRAAVIKLRFWLGLTPDQIQTALGISERTYRKEVERAYRELAAGVRLVREGRFCDTRRGAVLAYMAGTAEPRRAAEARVHLDSCAACRQMAVAVRDAASKAAAMLPLPEPTVHHGPLGHCAELLAGLRDQLEGLVGVAKQHAVSAATRIDSSAGHYAAGARPGAVATIVVGCLAVGGGATYCAVEGLPAPLAPLAGMRAEKPTVDSTPTPKHGPEVEEAQPPAAETPPPTGRAAPAREDSDRTAASARSEAIESIPPARAPTEFEPTGTRATSTPSVTAEPSGTAASGPAVSGPAAPSHPARGASQAAGEFAP
jgi:hypothetical protein